MAEWYSENKNDALATQKIRYEKNKTDILEKCKDYRDKNRGKITIGFLDWVRRNPIAYRNIQRRYEKTPSGRAGKFMRRCIARTLLGEVKDSSSKDYLGYSRCELVAHIESMFEPWMNWGNHGTEWHIDHIVPIAKFIADGNLSPSVVNALGNLRPLCAKENLKKGSKLLEDLKFSK